MKLVTKFGKGRGEGGKGSKQLYCHFLPWGQYVCVRLRGYRPSLCAQKKSRGLETITVCVIRSNSLQKLRVFIMFVTTELNLNVLE